MNVASDALTDRSWPHLWRAGSVAMILGVIDLVWWSFADFSIFAGYRSDGSWVPPYWDTTLILGVSVVTLVTLGLLGSSSYLLWRRSDRAGTGRPLRGLIVASMAWIVIGSMEVRSVDRMWTGFRLLGNESVFTLRAMAWRIHLDLSAFWFGCAAVALVSLGSLLYASVVRPGSGSAP